jgi:hypothetical protein
MTTGSSWRHAACDECGEMPCACEHDDDEDAGSERGLDPAIARRRWQHIDG